jgi:hypothetical protein
VSPAELQVVAATGTVIDLAGPTEDLVAAADDISEAIHELYSAKAAITSVVAARLDKLNRRSDQFGRFTVKVNAPKETVWDIDGLRSKLWTLVGEGVLDESVVIDDVIKSVVEYKVSAREVNKLRKHADERVIDAITSSERQEDQRRYLSISLAGEDE